MLGTFSNSVSSRFRAIVGKVKKTVAKQDCVEEVEPVVEQQAAPVARFDGFDFEEHRVETESREVIGIKVSKVPDTLYFEEEAPYAPTVVQVAHAPVSEPVFSEPARKENGVAAEPADLFINALRRPTRQKFDASEPRIKKKVVEEAPVEEIPAEVPVAEVTVEPAPVEVPAAIVVEQVEPQAVSIEVREDVVSIITEVPAEAPVVEVATESVSVETVIEEPAIDPIAFESAEVEEIQVEKEISKTDITEIMPEPVAIEVEEAPVSAPILVTPALPAKIQVPELDRAEPVETVFAEFVSSADGVLTSADEVIVEEVHETPASDVEKKILPQVIVNEDRDVLLLFRSELEAEEKTLSLTSMDNNSDLPEDYLDETELTFKIRVPRRYNSFNGHFRPVGFY